MQDGAERRVTMWIIIPVLVVLTVVYLLLDALVIVPGPSYGVHLRFEERTGKIYEEGLGWKIPIIDSVELFSTELDKITVVANFTTDDDLQLELEGSLQYRPDPRISDDPDDLRLKRKPHDRKGKNVFFSMSDEIIRSGIEDALEALLGGLGGVYTGEEFISSRQALGMLINSILRLGHPMHLNHDPATCGFDGCTDPRKVDVADLVKFYNNHWRTVKVEIDDEAISREVECSPIELRYGIDIKTFALAKVDFTLETKKALEKKKQAELSKAAFVSKLEMAKDAQRELGATAQEALNAADVSIDAAVEKKVVSVEGAAGILGGFIGKMGGS